MKLNQIANRFLASFDSLQSAYLYCKFLNRHGQVAQLVERGPEKAGVGGSIPSLATISFNNLQIAKNILPN
jgi:hypothetical protein